MQLTDSSLVEFCLVEYRRDSKFQVYVDAIIGALTSTGAVRPGTPLAATLGRELQNGELCAKALLRRYHGQSDQPQWLKHRQAEAA